ncbi:hypothetical protein [Microbacterium rhizophilus]|uniref:hypothetical protein n=1 Tax=Microbacterium rhizophilus TaxID=3138934 RepID=UPI0031EF788F
MSLPPPGNDGNDGNVPPVPPGPTPPPAPDHGSPTSTPPQHTAPEPPAPYGAPAPGQVYPEAPVPPYGAAVPPTQAYPPGGAPYGGAPYGGAPQPRPAGRGLAITGLVLGILGFIGAVIPFGIFFAGLLVLAALVIGIIVLVRKMPGKGMGIAAVILGGLGLVVGIISTVLAVSFFATQVPGIIQQACEEQGLTQEECDAYFQEQQP